MTPRILCGRAFFTANSQRTAGPGRPCGLLRGLGSGHARAPGPAEDLSAELASGPEGRVRESWAAIANPVARYADLRTRVQATAVAEKVSARQKI